jgi:hypothetical protein
MRSLLHFPVMPARRCIVHCATICSAMQLGRMSGKTRKEDLDKESQHPNLLRPTKIKTLLVTGGARHGLAGVCVRGLRMAA